MVAVDVVNVHLARVNSYKPTPRTFVIFMFSV